MKEKAFIKQATDLKMPDYEKVKRNILRSKVNYSKPSNLRKSALVFACCCLVIFSVLAFPNLINEQGESINSEVDDTKKGNQIIYNSLDETLTNTARLYFDPEKTYKVELAVDEVISYLGIDVRPTKLPDGLKGYTEVYPDSKFMAIYNNDNTVAYKQFAFSYKEDFEEYNPLEKQLEVTVSKYKFLRCYVFLSDDQMDKSTIAGQEILLGKRKMAYGPYTVVEDGPNIPAGHYDLFVAQFIMDDVHFEVVADNFTEDEFIETIASIINK